MAKGMTANMAGETYVCMLILAPPSAPLLPDFLMLLSPPIKVRRPDGAGEEGRPEVQGGHACHSGIRVGENGGCVLLFVGVLGVRGLCRVAEHHHLCLSEAAQRP